MNPDSNGPGQITLESLLDSPIHTPSLLSDSSSLSPLDTANVPNVAQSGADIHTSTLSTTQNQWNLHDPQKSALLREFCIELLFVLRNQDVNGYFLSQPVNVKELKGMTTLGLVDIEKRLLTNQYRTINHFKSDIAHLFIVALACNPSGSPAHTEAQRLLTVCSDWFASLPEHYISAFNADDQHLPSITHLAQSANSLDQPAVPSETHLGVLNPDNHGIIGNMKRVRSIGEEIGPLRSGTHLLPHGGYREDRRNKVVPYTYLDYGPFYSFAPHYDSGASHCTPESHQLVLSTCWIPARTKYLPPTTTPPTASSNPSDGATDKDEIAKALESDTVRAALSLNDHSLVVSLAVAEMEQQNTLKLSNELDAILPGPDVDEDCVYSMCLANALMSDVIKKQNVPELENTAKFAPVCSKEEHIVDLDQGDSDDEINLRSTSPALAVDHLDTSQELAETASDLKSLYCTQYRRLGDLSQSTTASDATLQPCTAETDIAHRLVGRLVGLVNRAKPRDLVHPYAVRKCMGNGLDSFPLPPLLAGNAEVSPPPLDVISPNMDSEL